jgi:hypothetical protein
MISLDGLKTLDFDENHKVSLIEEDKSEDDKSKAQDRNTFGTWSYDEHHERFTIIINERWTDYKLVRPEGSNICILAAGDVRSANLAESWFGTVDAEPPDDRDR